VRFLFSTGIPTLFPLLPFLLLLPFANVLQVNNYNGLLGGFRLFAVSGIGLSSAVLLFAEAYFYTAAPRDDKSELELQVTKGVSFFVACVGLFLFGSIIFAPPSINDLFYTVELFTGNLIYWISVVRLYYRLKHLVRKDIIQ
jgi:hypothetical protein